MSSVLNKFLSYVAIDTQSKEEVSAVPSTNKQFRLAQMLLDELKAMGVEDARLSDNCYVYGSIPASAGYESEKALGFVAHIDTSPDASGENVKPRIVKYEGGALTLENGLKIDPVTFPNLTRYVGQDIIVTDGTTLLGADDKAGVAEIMAAAETLISDPSIKHGKICIAFTPDEEVGNGTEEFSIPEFGADMAYTVDGGTIGELEYENFNAASAFLTFHGVGIHPGSAKDKMLNSLHVAEEFDAMMPCAQRPEYTEGYEGFIHLTEIEGDIVTTKMHYIIRDHDMAKFTAKKKLMEAAASYINHKYGEGTLELVLRDSYFNMREKILPHMYLIDTAKAAMKAVGVEPIVSPIRGGTDGARLTEMGLPCPNICTGGENYHGCLEYIPVASLEKTYEIILKIVELTYKA